MAFCAEQFFGFFQRTSSCAIIRRYSKPINQESVEVLFSSVINRAQSTLQKTNTYIKNNTGRSDGNDPRSLPTPTCKKPKSRQPAERKYKDNPAITNIALAQSLWKSILKPNIDSAIDATCGNGYDSKAIARILFNDYEIESSSKSQLLSIDIQAQACGNTTEALKEDLGDEIFDRHVQVLEASHSPLPRPGDEVGLVVYNLGWLPKSNKDCITKVDSTLESITDAILMVRVGGMISVVTYPKTNPEEDLAVRAFFECVALLSSNIQTWLDFLEDYRESQCSVSEETMSIIVAAIDRLVEHGNPKQTWRVSEHRKLGMDRAPILVTATRIK
jgi:hypothetical protein